MFKAFTWLSASVLAVGFSYAAQLESYIPQSNVEEFIGASLDLSTFRNSTGPSRTENTRTFKSQGMSPTLAEGGKLQYDSSDWFYGIEIKGRKDYNRDGIEDLALCFTDKAKKGTYATSNSLLATRYSEDGLLVVLGYQVEACD